MNITFRQGPEELSSKLIGRTQIKLTKLSKFFTGRNDEALVYVDVERESGSRNSDSMWRTSVNLDLVGELFNAVGRGSTPDKSTDLAIKELKREVRTAKGRQRSIARRGQDLLKRLRRSAE